MKTFKEEVLSVAVGLGCSEEGAESVWGMLHDAPLPLTAKSFVYQVANAMEALDMKPDSSKINSIASRL